VPASASAPTASRSQRALGVTIASWRPSSADAGAGVEGARRGVAVVARRPRRDDGHVADPAEVLKGAPAAARREEQRVGDRDERRALPPRGDVADAEVAHHVESRALGDHGALAELPG
jgi:hypothetical protein